MKVEERVNDVDKALSEFVRRMPIVEDTIELRRDFIRKIVLVAREDEKKHQRALKRIDNLKRWISSSEFNDTSKHYAMSLTLLGYDNLAEMKEEITDYSPDLLNEFALFKNTEGLGESFLLKDYEPNTENQESVQTPEARN